MNRILLIIALPLFAMGCATSPSQSRWEPPIVAIRNVSGQDLATVTVRENLSRNNQSRRLASASPLLHGAVYSIRRQANPRPLSDEMVVMWKLRNGVSETTTVSIEDALRKRKGVGDEALIFHILPGGQVMVSVDPLRDPLTAGR